MITRSHWFHLMPQGGTVYTKETPVSAPTPDPVFSRYARLNAGLTELVTAMQRGGVAPGLVELARELATEAHTVETAAMARALTWYRDTYLKESAEEALGGDPATTVMSELVQRTNTLIKDITPPAGQ